MDSRVRSGIAPAYLFSCLILGGSAQGIWQNMLLQLAGVAIVAWAAIEERDERLTARARQLAAIAILAIAVAGLQMTPLPSTFWPHAGPRQEFANAFRLLGLQVPAQPQTQRPENLPRTPRMYSVVHSSDMPQHSHLASCTSGPGCSSCWCFSASAAFFS